MMEELLALGLDAKEAKLYLAVLERGEAPVRELADSSGVGRTNAYDVVDRLIRRGLVAQVDVGTSGRKVVVATDPYRLIEKWEEQRRQLDEIVPALRAMHRDSAQHTRVRYYEGAEGISTVLYSTLRSTGPLLGILSMRDLFTVPGEAAMNDYVAERTRRDLHLRVVRSRQKDLAPHWSTDPAARRDARYAPEGYVFTMTMFIMDDTVAVISSRVESFGMTIESAEYAELQRNLFEVLWEASSPT
jgi:sugar-specific transcriptional regulator TrmB